jgi:glycosyltransferase involved in cell wall biosynthesis
LTTYNRPELLIRAFESVKAQTFQPKEIILVDDSSDKSATNFIKKHLSDDIIYLKHKDNLGLAAARNTGLRHAKQDFIAYLDDDDIWMPTRLDLQVKHWESLPIVTRKKLACIQVGAEIVNTNGNRLNIYLPKNHGNLKECIIRDGAVTISSCFLFVKKALLNVNGFDENLISGIDDDVWMSLAEAGYSNEIIPKPLVRIIQDDRESMMVDTNRRVTGLDQYVNKWLPVYKNWFGEINGQKYARRYFNSAISTLIGQKFAIKKYADGLSAFKAIFIKTGFLHPIDLTYAIHLIIKTWFGLRFPRIKKSIVGILRMYKLG